MQIPVLMYHNVTEADKGFNRYTVNFNSLELQMRYLSDNGYHSLTVNEYQGTIESGGNNFPSRSVALTFDDSYLNYYTHILPLLKRYNLKANFFITTNYIGKGKEYLCWEHLIEMKNSGMSIQAHTHTHRFLDDLNSEEIMTELEKSKYILENGLGCKVDFFSCPGGRFNNIVKEVAKGLGYKGMFTSVPRFDFSTNGNFCVFGRLLITSNISEPDFVKLLNLDDGYILARRMDYQLKYYLKKLFGNRLYYFFWKKLIK